jgi:pyruvate formate lyase activating enzyme
VKCVICGNETYTETIPICPRCAKTEKALEFVSKLHEGIEKIKGIGKVKCKLCSNECGFDDGGLCGLRFAKDGKLVSLVSSDKAILYAYEDPLPTNCCNAWFCEGSKLRGMNLAVFYYGCNFDCLFCQNWSHKNIAEGKIVSVEEMVERAMPERVKCICHFGGSPEPQLPFAIKFSSEVLKKRNVMICWEWNGAGRTSLALKSAELSYKSGGTVKFDLKAWNPYLHMVLTGRSNEQTLKNFEKIFDKYPEVLSATTLLVPYYVDEEEVEGIARFLAELSDEIPYSLLIFHPDYKLSDMPVTPKSQVKRCYEVAKRYLKRVNIGNKFLLAYAPD